MLVSGSAVPVLSAAKERVDFVCPIVAPEMPLEIAAETESGWSKPLHTKMDCVAPVTFTVDGSGDIQTHSHPSKCER